MAETFDSFGKLEYVRVLASTDQQSSRQISTVLVVRIRRVSVEGKADSRRRGDRTGGRISRDW